MLVVGVTGVMGAGKSTVSSMLAELGARVIDADKVAHGLMLPFGPVWWSVCEYFGPGIINRDTDEIDRVKLGAIIFSDLFFLSRLNSLVHPAVIEEIKSLVNQFCDFGVKMTVIDAPLLIEAGLHYSVDIVVVVLIDKDIQMKRLEKKYPQLTCQQIRQRLDSQLSQEDKQRYAYFKVDNSGTLQDTRRQVEEIFYLLQGDDYRNSVNR